MRRVRIRAPGGYDRLVIEDVPDLSPAPGHVVVAVSSAGVNYADSIVRMGLYASAKQFVGYPITPGFEFAGTLVAVGSGVDGLQSGDRVFGVTFFDGYASQVCVRASQVFPLPSGLSMVQGATFPAAFLTAWYAAVRMAALRSDARVLVHSAAGGVGSALTQVCRMLGCAVVGVVGSRSKVQYAERMGCEVVIDKSHEQLWDRLEKHWPAGCDAVFDATGLQTLKGSYEHLAQMGRLVTYGFHSMLPRVGGRPNVLRLAVDFVRTPRFNPIRMAEQNRSVMGFNLSFLFGEGEVLRDGMVALLQGLDAGTLRPLPVKVYAFEDVARAQADIESGSTTGKLALTVTS